MGARQRPGVCPVPGMSAGGLPLLVLKDAPPLPFSTRAAQVNTDGRTAGTPTRARATRIPALWTLSVICWAAAVGVLLWNTEHFEGPPRSIALARPRSAVRFDGEVE